MECTNLVGPISCCVTGLLSYSYCFAYIFPTICSQDRLSTKAAVDCLFSVTRLVNSFPEICLIVIGLSWILSDSNVSFDGRSSFFPGVCHFLEMELTNDQEKTFNLTSEGYSFVITGQGGTGKTFVIRKIYDHLKNDKNLACSTGIACTLYESVTTLHSWSGILDGRYTKMDNLNLISNDEKFRHQETN